MASAGLGAVLIVAGCHASHPVAPLPQDSFQVRPSSSMTLLPDATMSRQYHPPADGTPDSPVAYQQTPTPSYADRTLNENLSGASEAVDYMAAMRLTGLADWLKASGPYTVFAIPNLPLEHYVSGWNGGFSSPEHREELLQLLQYTVVKGRWTEAALRQAIHRRHGRGVGLVTLTKATLNVQIDPANGELVVSNARGETDRLWLLSVPQSNGVLYFTQGVLTPVLPVIPRR